MTTTDPGYFRLERRANNMVVYLAKESQRTLTVPTGTTREQVAIALGDLPSGSHNRYELARERLKEAGLHG